MTSVSVMNEAVLLSHGANSCHIQAAAFAVASNKLNADFHGLFKTIPQGSRVCVPGPSGVAWLFTGLKSGCALQRETPVKGRPLISEPEKHIYSHANIFGWATNVRKHSI